MRKAKRFISLILTILMVLTLMPVSAWADEPDQVQAVQNEITEDAEAASGDLSDQSGEIQQTAEDEVNDTGEVQEAEAESTSPDRVSEEVNEPAADDAGQTPAEEAVEETADETEAAAKAEIAAIRTFCRLSGSFMLRFADTKKSAAMNNANNMPVPLSA